MATSQQLKAIQDRIRAGEVSNAQAMLLDLTHMLEQHELEEQIAAGNPPPPPDANECLVNLLEAMVVHHGSPPALVKHLEALKGTVPQREKIAAEEKADDHEQAPAGADQGAAQ